MKSIIVLMLISFVITSCSKKENKPKYDYIGQYDNYKYEYIKGDGFATGVFSEQTLPNNTKEIAGFCVDLIKDIFKDSVLSEKDIDEYVLERFKNFVDIDYKKMSQKELDSLEIELGLRNDYKETIESLDTTKFEVTKGGIKLNLQSNSNTKNNGFFDTKFKKVIYEISLSCKFNNDCLDFDSFTINQFKTSL